MNQHSDLRGHSLWKSILNQIKEDSVSEKLFYFHLQSCAPPLNELWCRCVGNECSVALGALVPSVAFISRFRSLLGDGRSEGGEQEPLKPKCLGIHHSCGVEI